MQQLKIIFGVLLITAVVFVTGCAGPNVSPDAEADGATEAAADTSGAGLEGDVTGGALSDGSEAEEVDPLTIKVVYFDFDESIVSAEGQAVIHAHAEVLLANPGSNLYIAGHADERGTREYNLALGDQRGEAVSLHFQQFGIDASRISVVSFGEEQPAVEGSNEEAWSLNRRAEFDYGN